MLTFNLRGLSYGIFDFQSVCCCKTCVSGDSVKVQFATFSLASQLTTVSLDELCVYDFMFMEVVHTYVQLLDFSISTTLMVLTYSFLSLSTIYFLLMYTYVHMHSSCTVNLFQNLEIRQAIMYYRDINKINMYVYSVYVLLSM